MRNTIIGLFIGVSFGIVLGASIIAPRLTAQPENAIGDAIATVPIPKTAPVPGATSAFWRAPSSAVHAVAVDIKLVERAYSNISSATGGAVWIEPGHRESDDRDPTPGSIYNAVLSGSVDVAIVDPGDGTVLSPAFDLFGSAPFGPRPRELMAWLYAGDGGTLLRDVHAEHGLFAVPCAITATSAAGWFRDSVAGLDDMQGLRMRIQGLAADAARKIGVETVDLRDEQLLAAFRTGHLDAAEVSLPSADRDLSLHEGARHYLFPGWHEPSTLLVLLTRLEEWQSLSASRQQQIEMACGDNVRHGIAETEAAQFEALKELASLGVEVGRLPNDVVSAFSAAWLTVAEEHAEDDESFAAVWHSLSAFREDYAIWNEISSF